MEVSERPAVKLKFFFLEETSATQGQKSHLVDLFGQQKIKIWTTKNQENKADRLMRMRRCPKPRIIAMRRIKQKPPTPDAMMPKKAKNHRGNFCSVQILGIF